MPLFVSKPACADQDGHPNIVAADETVFDPANCGRVLLTAGSLDALYSSSFQLITKIDQHSDDLVEVFTFELEGLVRFPVLDLQHPIGAKTCYGHPAVIHVCHTRMVGLVGLKVDANRRRNSWGILSD